MKDWKFVQVGNGSGYNGSNLTQEKYEEAQKSKKRWEEEKKDAEATIAKYEKLVKENPDNSSFGRILDGAKSRVKEAESNLAYLKREIGNKYEGEHITVKVQGKTADVKVLKDNGDGTYEVKTIYGGVLTVKETEIVGNKVGNESVVKQEWSMFNGLADKAKKEIGNSTGDEYNAEIQRLTKKAEQLRRMGQGKSAMEIEKQIEKLGKELRELGNKKTGNIRPNGIEDLTGKNVWVKDKGDEWKVYVLQDKGDKLYIKDTDGHMGWVDIGRVTGLVGNSKTGNEETKAERKFGKVMGEFEEGSLKTPQGKTVTDPKQAKAIAYSEADKVDNLKRARNAIKKQ